MGSDEERPNLIEPYASAVLEVEAFVDVIDNAEALDAMYVRLSFLWSVAVPLSCEEDAAEGAWRKVRERLREIGDKRYAEFFPPDRVRWLREMRP